MTSDSLPPRAPAWKRLLTVLLFFTGGALLVIALAIMASRKPAGRGAEGGPRIVRAEHSSADPASGSASLSITSEPPGATVLVNGSLVGCTPVTVEDLQAGDYGLRLERNGCKPLSRIVPVSGRASVREKLEPLPTGSVTVDVTPHGAEVLLDGEVVGNSPMKADNLPAGPYELLVRKTNFDSYLARIEVVPGETLVFSGFALNDKILDMLERNVKSEPQRLAHYIDLGHYLFVNSRMDEAVDIFAQGYAVMQTPLDFNGPGFTGEENMSREERELERRLRQEDTSRYQKELEKHRNWPRKDTRTFRAKLEQAKEILEQKNAASWPWVEATGRMNIRAHNYERAGRIYEDFIAASPKSPDLPQAYIALIEVRLMQRDVDSARESFDKFFAQYHNDAAALRNCGGAIYPYQARSFVSRQSRAALLEMAEKALRRGLELTRDGESRAQCLCDLGTVLNYSGAPNEAADCFEKSVAATKDPQLQEDRMLLLADALRKAERYEEAEVLYQTLKKSERASVRESANTGILWLPDGRKRRGR